MSRIVKRPWKSDKELLPQRKMRKLLWAEVGVGSLVLALARECLSPTVRLIDEIAVVGPKHASQWQLRQQYRVPPSDASSPQHPPAPHTGTV